MREILFRGKAKYGYKYIEKGEWIEGSMFYSDDENGTVCQIATSYLTSNKDEPVMVVAYEVYPETVCQYTGLSDNTKWEELSEEEKEKFLSELNHKEDRLNTKDDWNGRKIFEGDIVRLEDYHGHRIVHVFYGNCGCWFYGGDGFSDEYIFNGSCKEIIGNIFDNPEMIGE